jgi:tetratricopeptide (TPR) repeat protein
LICKTLKKLSSQLRPSREVWQVIIDLIEGPEKIGKNTRVLRHALSYAEFQFGTVSGQSYHEREIGKKSSNWIFEMEILCRIYDSLIGIYRDDESLSLIMKDNMMLPHLEKMLNLLRPWSALIDSDDTCCLEVLDKYQVNIVTSYLSRTESEMAFLLMRRNEYSLAESHCNLALSYARRDDGAEEEKTSLLFDALTAYSNLRSRQGNLADAVTFLEEAYNCVAITYNPVHPKVQMAAGNLIGCLTNKGDYYNAETFAQMTLDSLKDPANRVDQDSEAVAKGYSDLGYVIQMQGGDLIKAERLARESYRIRVHLYGNEHFNVGASTCLLANILMARGNLGDETKKLNETSLAIFIRNEGLDGINVAAGIANIGFFQANLADRQLNADKRKEHLCLSVSYMKEASRISTKVRGPTHPKSIKYAAELENDIQRLSEA